MDSDLYSVLGVNKTSSQDDIKRAFRKLAAKLHPDKNPGDAAAEAQFKRVNLAHQVLSDKKRRALYDEFGAAALSDNFNAEQARAARNWGQPGGFNWGGNAGQNVNLEDLFGGNTGGGFGDLFSDLFVGGKKRRTQSSIPSKGKDLETTATLELVDAVRGTTISCDIPNQNQQVQVRIPPGAKDGSKIRIKGYGSPSAFSGPPGDLLIKVNVNTHPHISVDGDDLHMNLPVTVAEAYRGTKIQVPTINGTVTLTVPAGTQTGTSARLRGKGIPRRNQPPGDLYVHFMVMIPTSQDPAVQNAIDTLAGFDSDVRSELRI
ncbi:MAG: J domain-containing protein [Polyangiaceae bacterium]|nr:J domain-containing protein [Polyangiaceae bacterium]